MNFDRNPHRYEGHGNMVPKRPLYDGTRMRDDATQTGRTPIDRATTGSNDVDNELFFAPSVDALVTDILKEGHGEPFVEVSLPPLKPKGRRRGTGVMLGCALSTPRPKLRVPTRGQQMEWERDAMLRLRRKNDNALDRLAEANEERTE